MIIQKWWYEVKMHLYTQMLGEYKHSYMEKEFSVTIKVYM